MSSKKKSKQNKNTELEDKKKVNLEDIMLAIQELKNEIKDIQRDMQFYADMYEEQKIKNTKYDDEIAQLKKQNSLLTNEILKIKSSLEVKEKDKRRNNLVIVGLKYKTQQNDRTWIKKTIKQAEKVIHFINPQLTLNNINIKLTNIKKDNSPVLLEFQTEAAKATFLERKKKKGRISLMDCGITEENSPLYINEDMTIEQQSLFKKTRELKNIGYKFVWAKGGNIYARKTEKSEIKRIKGEEDLILLKN